MKSANSWSSPAACGCSEIEALTGFQLYQGLAALDCPLCRQPVGFQGGRIGPAPPGVPLKTRHADQAAQWAASQAISAGGTLQGIHRWPGPGPSTQPTGPRKRFCKQTSTDERNKEDRKMRLLTPEENRFLDVFLHEATTAPFTGPATKPLHKIGVEYGDILYLAWAYEQEVPRTGFAVGHAADVAPPLPWPNRQSALRRNQEIQRIWEHRQQRGEESVGQNERERKGNPVHEVGTQGHPGRETTRYYPGTEEAHTNPTRQRGECLRALAGASGDR